MARCRILSIAHSYCVALNRQLVNEMGRISKGQCEVTAVAPSFFPGDLRPVPLERDSNEICHLEAVPVHMASRIHVMLYGNRLHSLLSQPWDIVHCWEEPYILAAGQIAWWARRHARIVFWTAQNIAKHYPPPFSWVEKYCVQHCAGWMAAGETVRQTLLSRHVGYSDRPHRVMPLGVDPKAFHPDSSAGRAIRAQLGWGESGPPVVGFLGRFVTEKGVDLLMNVLDTVQVPWRALFIGGGPREQDLRNWAKRHGDNVRVVTGVKHNEVPAYLNSLDVLCAPSQTTRKWREQFGRMLIEAFACGVPVLASDSGEIPYVVEGAGTVSGEQDHDAWRRQLAVLLDNSAARADLSRRGLHKAQTCYTWPVIARRHLQFFEELRASGRN